MSLRDISTSKLHNNRLIHPQLTSSVKHHASEPNVASTVVLHRYAADEFLKRGVGKGELAVITEEPVRFLPGVPYRCNGQLLLYAS